MEGSATLTTKVIEYIKDQFYGDYLEGLKGKTQH